MIRTALLTSSAMLAFAGNSLLCRLALRDTEIDAASFTAIRLGSGALILAALLMLRGRRPTAGGSWPMAAMLFAYAVCFSFAYRDLTAATGALLLFGAVQLTMMGYGLWTGERIRGLRLVGLLFALGGLVWLLLPGLAAPPLLAAALMLVAGAAWGVYSAIRRRRPAAISCARCPLRRPSCWPQRRPARSSGPWTKRACSMPYFPAP
jgi:drug/metabolite transporter (DMT)-like permease